MDVAVIPGTEHAPSPGWWRRAVAAVLGRADDRRIRQAYAQRESLTGDRPTVTVIRGPVPDFLQDLPRVS